MRTVLCNTQSLLCFCSRAILQLTNAFLPPLLSTGEKKVHDVRVYDDMTLLKRKRRKRMQKAMNEDNTYRYPSPSLILLPSRNMVTSEQMMIFSISFLAFMVPSPINPHGCLTPIDGHWNCKGTFLLSTQDSSLHHQSKKATARSRVVLDFTKA